MYRGVYSGKEYNFFFNTTLTNQKPVVTHLIGYIIEIDQSQITESKITCKSKMSMMAKESLPYFNACETFCEINHLIKQYFSCHFILCQKQLPCYC